MAGKPKFKVTRSKHDGQKSIVVEHAATGYQGELIGFKAGGRQLRREIIDMMGILERVYG